MLGFKATVIEEFVSFLACILTGLQHLTPCGSPLGNSVHAKCNAGDNDTPLIYHQVNEAALGAAGPIRLKVLNYWFTGQLIMEI